MKMNSIIALFIGALAGAAFTSGIIWFWTIATGNNILISIVGTILVATAVFIICRLHSLRAIEKANRTNSFQLEKYQTYYKLFGSWMVLRNKGRKLEEYFEDHNLKNVAIYGLGRFGLCLYEELKTSSINVKYAIDKNARHFSYLNLKVISLENQIETVDGIVVTPFFEYKRIAAELRERTACKILNLEDVISSI
jgi:hypothetical protein